MKSLLAVCCFWTVSTLATAQTKDSSRITIPELKLNFNKSGSNYIKGTFLAQTWARYSEFNPGTTVDGTPKSTYCDIGIRRWRIQFFGQLTNRIYFYTQFGQNNFSFLQPRHTGAFLHDAITEFRALKQLQIGAGLTAWGGVSRFSSPSVANLMGVDAPIYQQATNGVNEQFGRKLSVYFKGEIARLNYRVALSRPMSVKNSTVAIPSINSNSNFNTEAPRAQTSGYVFWQFFDKESTPNPYMVGTYLGKKKLLNLGVGWVHQNKAMWHTTDSGDTIRTALLLLGADVFLDLPTGTKGAALNVYVAYNHFDYGKNYVRMLNGMNPANGVNSEGTLNGAGVNYPMIGTGNILFAQIGYKLKDDLFATDNGTLMPYTEIQYAHFQALKDPSVMCEAGLNWFIHGTHGAKLSLGLQNRPVFDYNASGKAIQTARKNMLVVQYQIAF
ncbi:hypothetical protein [Fluviicola chungangensis]|uniref:Porin n=1 Tax=Fluviicola chungangensis TaxID=2597671 RepID=A0A556MXW1_9FLAO|nr:hypothetical protein [Fluviicola chungangensis]TSJ44761.1 hypothetical protein FO442_09170 [Fluviicola chungangensis]